MQLYVPEIGDEIRLTQAWEFELHAEHRNEQLAAFFGHYIQGYGNGVLIEEAVLPRLRPIDYQVNYPDREDSRFRKMFGGWDYQAYELACEQARLACPEYVQYQKDSAEWHAQAKQLGKPTIRVILPAGTLLKIDRIYIRKGASDFSSITFYAKELGEVVIPGSRWSWGNQKPTKRKAQRFWAKLADCNQIQFDRAE